jgi:D-alanyl-D-alanine dipeptidase
MDPRARIPLWVLPGAFLAGPAPAGDLDQIILPAAHGQVILVTTDGWNHPVAQLVFADRDASGVWREAGRSAAVVGASGLGWGLGLHRDPADGGPRKVEGDLRGPAGIFALGPAFGYSSAAPPGTRWEYRQATARDYFVDDPGSSQYNQWVRLPGDEAPDRHWRSFERMKRSDHLYMLGVVVRHNMDPVAKGRGSAIFLHVWRAPGRGTSGCTALPAEVLGKLIAWLDPGKSPVLVQVPRGELHRVAF